jgi:hypothetical protein
MDPTDHDTNDADEEHVQQQIPKLSYMITMFSLEELKKPSTRRKAKSRLIELSSALEWIDMCGMVKRAVCDLLFPEQAVVDDDRYEMTWCIPRVVPQALSLASTADYDLLIKKVLKMKDPNGKILVDEKAGNTVRNE